MLYRARDFNSSTKDMVASAIGSTGCPVQYFAIHMSIPAGAIGRKET
jgi:hypothetical protein